jgi:hypothetical protein
MHVFTRETFHAIILASVFHIMKRMAANHHAVTTIATLALSVLWFFLVMHAGFLVSILGRIDFDFAGWGVMGCAALLLYKRPNCFVGVYSIILVWFLLFFLKAWSVGINDLCTAKMLIPVGDCAGHLFEAARLAHGQLLTEWGSHHMVSHGYAAALSFLLGQNLQHELLLMAIVAALGLAYCTMAVRAAFGALAGAVFLMMAGLFFFDNNLGTLSVEMYGVPMGLLGTALLLEGAKTGKWPWQLAGIFVLSIALIARMGAFLVLPLAGLSLAISQPTWRRRALMLGASAGCVIFAFLLNALLTKFLCEPQSTPMGMDFWHHLYGMLTGGTWNSSIATHSAQEAKNECFKLLHGNPALVFSASWKAIRFFFSELTSFAYLPWRWLNIGLACMLAPGAACCLVFIRRSEYRLVLFCMVGILLSIPFVPPWDAGIRPYAATMPLQIIGAVAALGMVSEIVAARMKRKNRDLAENTTHVSYSGHAAALAGVILSLCLVMPLLMTKTGMHFGKPETAYLDGKSWIRFVPGTYLRIIPDNAAKYSYVPFIRRSDYVRENKASSNIILADKAAVFDRMPAGVVVTRADSFPIIVVKDVWTGNDLPENTFVEADLVQFKGDKVVMDKNAGLDAETTRKIAEAVYMPWFTGYQYYYKYHPVLGEMSLVDITPNGKSVIWTEKIGKIETDSLEFPRIKRLSDGRMLRLDVEKNILLDDSTGLPTAK